MGAVLAPSHNIIALGTRVLGPISDQKPLNEISHLVA
jgi:hypothetical protein